MVGLKGSYLWSARKCVSFSGIGMTVYRGPGTIGLVEKLTELLTGGERMRFGVPSRVFGH